MREREYTLEEIELRVKAYFREGRTVLKNEKYGFITLPVWMIGNKFDVVLIPK